MHPKKHLITRKRPGFVTVAAVLMGLSAISPALKGIAILGRLSLNANVTWLLLYYWGDVFLSLILAWGLWNLKNWARIIVIIILSVAVLTSFIWNGIAGVIFLLVFGYVIYWLFSHEEYFTAQNMSNTEESSTEQTNLTENLQASRGEIMQSTEKKEMQREQRICPKCGTVNSSEETFFCGACLTPLPNVRIKSKSGLADIAAFVVGAIGILIGANGLGQLLFDTNVMGLYCNVPLAFVLLIIAWVIGRGGK